MSFIQQLTPTDLDIPPSSISAYRSVQTEALEFIAENIDNPKYRALGLALPQGSGKSWLAWSVAKFLGLRTAVLTATKALENQYMSEMHQLGLVDIRGRANYQCGHYDLNCKGGSTMGCPLLKTRTCNYQVAKRTALSASVVVTNYAYWMTANDRATGLEERDEDGESDDPIELLICDEGHECVSKISDYIAIRIYEKSIHHLGGYPKDSDEVVEWAQWAKECIKGLEEELKTSRMELAHLQNVRRLEQRHVDTYHRLEKLYQSLSKLARLKYDPDNWVCALDLSDKYGRSWEFNCIWPGTYAESVMFCGVKKVLVMSASLKPKTMHLMGMKDSEFGYKSWRRIFPANRNPIYMCGAKKSENERRNENDKRNSSTIRIDRKTTDSEFKDFVQWMDEELIAPRLDRKGLIQTVSYSLQDRFMELSKYSNYMIGNTSDPESDSAYEVARVHRESDAPSILCSPSFSTGWDLKGDVCEWVFLPKVPFEAFTKLTKARDKKDSSYSAYRTMQTIEQSAMRGMRFMEDRCEVVLGDGHFEWFLYRYKGLAQDWFVKAVRKVGKLPKPPKKL